jgi:hypothetical protein
VGSRTAILRSGKVSRDGVYGCADLCLLGLGFDELGGEAPTGLQTSLMVNSIFNGWRMEDVWLDK